MSFEDRIEESLGTIEAMYALLNEVDAKMHKASAAFNLSPNDPASWRAVCQQWREVGEDYIRFGSQWRQIADYIEPTMDDMIERGKGDVRDD